MTLRYFGIRVTDLARSTRFYTEGLGLKETRRGTMSHGGKWVMLEDPETKQRLELNWYPEDNPYHTPFTPGETFDHFGVEADDARKEMDRLVSLGATVAVDAWDENERVTLGYVKGPDEEWIEVFNRE